MPTSKLAPRRHTRETPRSCSGRAKLEPAIAEYLRIVEDQPQRLELGEHARRSLRARRPDRQGRRAVHAASPTACNEEGFLPKAGALYKKILKLKPDHEPALLQAAEILRQPGALADARAYFNTVDRAAARARATRAARAGEDPARLARPGGLRGADAARQRPRGDRRRLRRHARSQGDRRRAVREGPTGRGDRSVAPGGAAQRRTTRRSASGCSTSISRPATSNARASARRRPSSSGARRGVRGQRAGRRRARDAARGRASRSRRHRAARAPGADVRRPRRHGGRRRIPHGRNRRRRSRSCC